MFLIMTIIYNLKISSQDKLNLIVWLADEVTVKLTWGIERININGKEWTITSDWYFVWNQMRMIYF